VVALPGVRDATTDCCSTLFTKLGPEAMSMMQSVNFFYGNPLVGYIYIYIYICIYI